MSVIADNVGRVLRDKRIQGGRIIEDVFAPWTTRTLNLCSKRFANECIAITERLETLLALILRIKADGALLEYSGRWLLDHLDVVTTATLLLYDASTGNDEIASHVAIRYVRSHISAVSYAKLAHLTAQPKPPLMQGSS